MFDGPLARPARLGVAALAALVLAACSPPTASPSPSASNGPTPRPTLSPRPTPTPVPTPLVSPGPTPGPSAVAGPDLVLRLTSCAELCIPAPGTTVLADGRLIWAGPDDRALETRLTPSGLDRIRVEVEGRPELAAGGEYGAELRPGAEPFPRGTTMYRFEVGGREPHVVLSGDPADYALEPDLWIIPPQMESLARLARQLLDPVAWLGPDALAGPIRPYRPERYLVLVELFPGVGSMPEFGVDIDAVDSPFEAPFENLGEAVQIDEGGFPVRCLVTDAETAARLADAENEAGVRRDIDAWSSGIPYRWDRAEGFVQVTLRQVLPHQAQPCAELALP
ncbi:MAG: hypothetical protein FIA92_00375 [Chloroflexi bacterium]|nr:hypothetical protein [Chloroflexota bacterium]